MLKTKFKMEDLIDKKILEDKLNLYYSNPEDPEPMWDFNKQTGQDVLDFCLKTFNNEDLFTGIMKYVSLTNREAEHYLTKPNISDFDMEQLREEELYNEELDKFNMKLSALLQDSKEAEKNLSIFEPAYSLLGKSDSKYSVVHQIYLLVGGDYNSVNLLYNDLKTKFSEFIPKEYIASSANAISQDLSEMSSVNTKISSKVEEITAKKTFKDQWAYEQWLLQNDDLLLNTGKIDGHHINKMLLSLNANEYDVFSKFLQEFSIEKSKTDALLNYVSEHLLTPNLKFYQIKNEIKDIVNTDQNRIFKFMEKLNSVTKDEKSIQSMKI